MRQIDAHVLAEEIDNLTITVAGKPARWNDAKHTVLRIIAEQPDIEAEPVKHGRWEEYQEPHIVCCSECDWGTGVNEKSNFCPNCGAKMDLEG